MPFDMDLKPSASVTLLLRTFMCEESSLHSAHMGSPSSQNQMETEGKDGNILKVAAMVDIVSFYPAQSLDWLGQYVACKSICVSVTIFLHILLITINYYSSPIYAGIFILLKPLKSKHWRRDQLRPVQEKFPRDRNTLILRILSTLIIYKYYYEIFYCKFC